MDTYPKQFGLLIAYLLPGFAALLGVSPLSSLVSSWMRPVHLGETGFGPPIYALMAATALGMICSSVRWMLIDHLHHHMGIVPPDVNYATMEKRLQSFDYVVEGTYRYYQFNANLLIAVLFAYPVNRILQTSPFLGLGTDLGMLILCAILFAASRDALAKYYVRSGRLLGHVAEKDSGDTMTNGFHHEEGSPKAKSEPKSTAKPEAVKKPDAANGKDAQSK